MLLLNETAGRERVNILFPKTYEAIQYCIMIRPKFQSLFTCNLPPPFIDNTNDDVTLTSISL